LEVFGDETKARVGWMLRATSSAGGQDLVATGDAAQQRHVLEDLRRIDCGVFS
jgi:hypothetical protein